MMAPVREQIDLHWPVAQELSQRRNYHLLSTAVSYYDGSKDESFNYLPVIHFPSSTTLGAVTQPRPHITQIVIIIIIIIIII